MSVETTIVEPWIAHWRPMPTAQIRLFCFHYAGGSAAIFRHWHEFVPPSVEIYAVQLPGRATRFGDEPFTGMTALIKALEEALRPYLQPPFAFFGHSMGALVSFELARALQRRHRPGPCHLIASGRHAPSVPDPLKLSWLSDSGFIQELRGYQGTPDYVLDSPELMALFMPMLRADFTLCETYEYQPAEPLDCPITAFGGMQDHTVDEEMLCAWGRESRWPFEHYLFPGGHFFIHENQDAFLQTLGTVLDEIVARHGTRELIS